MSGYSEHPILQEDVLNSSAAFVQKPFGLDAFAYKVREVLDSGPGQTDSPVRFGDSLPCRPSGSPHHAPSELEAAGQVTQAREML